MGLRLKLLNGPLGLPSLYLLLRLIAPLVGLLSGVSHLSLSAVSVLACLTGVVAGWAIGQYGGREERLSDTYSDGKQGAWPRSGCPHLPPDQLGSRHD